MASSRVVCAAQKMAIGFQGEPVAPGRRRGRPATMNSQRPSCRAGLRQLLELQAVRDAHAHRDELQGVDRIGHALDVARHRLAVAVGQEGRDPPLVHPGHRVDMQPGLALAGRRVVVAPRAERQTALVMAGAEDEDVALAELHTLRRLDRLELGAVHGLARLQPVDAAVLGGVEQHAAADDAGGVGGDAAPFRAARGQQSPPACRCRAGPGSRRGSAHRRGCGSRRGSPCRGSTCRTTARSR